MDKVNSILEFKEGFVDRLNELFGRWGLFVYDYPYHVIIVTILVTIIPLFGFVPPVPEWIDGADNLYALPVSQARNDGIIHDTLFSDAISRASFMIVTSNPPGHNVLTWDALEWARQVDEIAQGRRVDPVSGTLVALPPLPKFYPEFYSDGNYSKTPDKSVLTYQDICGPDPVTGCKIQSVFEMGVDEVKLLLPEDAPPELYVFDGLVYNTKRKGYSPSFVLGDMTLVPCTRELPLALVSQIFNATRYKETEGGMAVVDIECITEAKALHFVYEVWDQPQFLERELAWESRFYEVLRNNEFYGPLRVGANAFRSRDDELSKSTAESDDIIFVVYTFILLIAYTTVVHFNCDAYRSKALSSLGGSLACLLGLVAGLGLPSLLGVAFVPTSLVAPFLVMGVGADDIFVIISSFALAYGEDTARQRCAVTLRGCGVSVVMTTITNVVAFAIGIQSPYLSIKNFCIFTLTGLGISLVYELTLFFAFVCLDARREEQQKACYHTITLYPDGKRTRTPFDIHKVVSTYQVVHVLVEEALKDYPEFTPMPAPSKRGENWFVRLWRVVSEGGNYWFRPETNLGEGAVPGFQISRQTTTTGGETSPLDDEKGVGTDKESDVKSVYGDAEEKDEMAKLVQMYLPPKKEKVDRFVLNPKLKHRAYRQEPPGTVGRHWRLFFIKGYGRNLLRPSVKAAILIIFTINFCLTCFGFTKLTQGLEMKDLSPDDSYLKVYDSLYAQYCSTNDLPVEVFFAEPTDWWDARAIRSLEMFVARVNSRPENNILSDPLTRMLQEEALRPSLASGNKTEFNLALKQFISDPTSAFKQFELDFVWRGDEMVGFRQMLLPAGTTGSQERAHWMLTLRNDCDWARSLPANNETLPISPAFYNFMLVFYESDIQIKKSVISSISTASMAMLVCAFMLIPDLSSGLMVIAIMLLIDMTIIGYMAFWDVPLNMISMVILVISIGFAVDYSAHICYAFVNSAGATRNLRAIESVVQVGTPLFHGAVANFLGIMLLGFSTSYILRIFFKMMTLVVLFGISHGLLLLPVLLSMCGRMTGSVPVIEDDFPPDFFKDYKSFVEKQASSVPILSDRHSSFIPAYQSFNMSVITGRKMSSEDEEDDFEDRAAEDSATEDSAVWFKDGTVENRKSIFKRDRPRAVSRVEFALPSLPENASQSSETPIPRRK